VPKVDILPAATARQFRISLRLACRLAEIDFRSLGAVSVGQTYANAETRDSKWIDNQLCESRNLTRLNALELFYRWMFHPVVNRRMVEEGEGAMARSLEEIKRLRQGARSGDAPYPRPFMNALGQMTRRLSRGFEWRDPRLILFPRQIKPLARSLARVATASRRLSESKLSYGDRLVTRFEDYLARNARAIVEKGLIDLGQELHKLDSPKVRRSLHTRMDLIDRLRAKDIVGDALAIAWGNREWLTPRDPTLE
jgi:hypothetical protein